MFINLTPHPITLQADDGTRFTVRPSGIVARLGSEPGGRIITEACGDFPAGVAVHDRTRYGEPEGLPGPGWTTLRVSPEGRVEIASVDSTPDEVPADLRGDPWRTVPPGGVTYIVSALFGGRVGDRTDVVYPGTGPADGCVRDDRGQVIAVTRLIRA